jgi:TolB-like protein
LQTESFDKTESVCSREDVLAALKAILSTVELARSESISRLLEYVVTNTLEGRENDLKEYNLGVDVFLRGQDFDPRLDNIVRVQARKLRLRLAAYYASPRTGVRIELPTGSYVPVFRRIEAAPNGAGPVEDASQPEPRGHRSRAGYWVTIGAVALAGFLAGFVCANRLARPSADTGAPSRVPVLLIPLVAAGGDPEEARAATLVSQLVHARLSRMAGLQVVDTQPARGFTIEGSARRTGDRIALTLSLLGDREQHGHGLRCSLTAQDNVPEAESLAGMLVERMMGHLRNLLEGTPRGGPAWGQAAADFDASEEFAVGGKAASNGSWSYGWEQQLRGPFRLYSRPFQVKYWGIDVTGWSQNGEGPENGDHCCPFVAKNTSGRDLREQVVEIPANQLWFHPGPKGEFSAVRWQGKAASRYTVEVRFSALSLTSTDVHVAKNGVSLMDGAIDGPGVWHDVLIRNLQCVPDDSIDFAVGFGANHNYNGDSTGLDVRIAPMRSGP